MEESIKAVNSKEYSFEYLDVSLNKLASMNNLTDKEIAQKIGVSKSVYSKLKHCNIKLDIEVLDNIVNTFDVDPDWLLKDCSSTEMKINHLLPADRAQLISQEAIRERLQAIKKDMNIKKDKEFIEGTKNITTYNYSRMMHSVCKISLLVLIQLANKYQMMGDFYLGYEMDKRVYIEHIEDDFKRARKRFNK